MAVKKKETTKAAEAVEEKVDTPVEGEETPEVEAPETDVEATEEAEETTENDTEDNSGAGITVETPVAEKETASRDKMVKIKPNCDYRFYYGNVWYGLVKDTVMTVPLEVKERLQQAGKLAAL